jgi:hypothetical protein
VSAVIAASTQTIVQMQVAWGTNMSSSHQEPLPSPAKRPRRDHAWGRKLSHDEVMTLLQSRRRVGGSTEYHHLAGGLRPGPTCMEEVFSWPRLMVKDYLEMQGGAERLRRVASLLETGLIIHTDCSGKCSPEATLEILDVALAENGIKLPPGWLVWWRACDNSKLCQRVISKLPRGPAHLFDGMLGKLAETAQDAIASMRPPKKSSMQAKLEAYANMDKYLVEHAALLYSKDAVASNCVLHPDQQCRLRWEDPPGLPESQRPLTVAIAGPPCRPFSLLGKRDTLGHSDIEALHLWRHDVANADFDLVFVENSSLVYDSLFKEHMPSKYLSKEARWGSQDQGWPVRRTRYYGVSINQATLVWIGPPEEDVLIDFLAYFGAAVRLDSDAFCNLDRVEEGQEALQRLARNRGVYLTAEQLRNCDWAPFLPRGQKETLSVASRMYIRGHKVGQHGAFAVDLSQTGTKPEPNWNQTGTKQEPNRNQAGTKPETKRNQSGTKPEPNWNQTGTKTETNRNQTGTQPSAHTVCHIWLSACAWPCNL